MGLPLEHGIALRLVWAISCLLVACLHNDESILKIFQQNILDLYWSFHLRYQVVRVTPNTDSDVRLLLEWQIDNVEVRI